MRSAQSLRLWLTTSLYSTAIVTTLWLGTGLATETAT